MEMAGHTKCILSCLSLYAWYFYLWYFKLFKHLNSIRLALLGQLGAVSVLALHHVEEEAGFDSDLA